MASLGLFVVQLSYRNYVGARDDGRRSGNQAQDRSRLGIRQGHIEGNEQGQDGAHKGGDKDRLIAQAINDGIYGYFTSFKRRTMASIRAEKASPTLNGPVGDVDPF